jgi:hypothetical protein
MCSRSSPTLQALVAGPSLYGFGNRPAAIHRHSVDLVVPNTARTVGCRTNPDPSAGRVAAGLGCGLTCCGFRFFDLFRLTHTSIFCFLRRCVEISKTDYRFGWDSLGPSRNSMPRNARPNILMLKNGMYCLDRFMCNHRILTTFAAGVAVTNRAQSSINFVR